MMSRPMRRYDHSWDLAPRDTDDQALDDLRHEILRRTRRVLPVDEWIDCAVERDGPRTVVRLNGPAVSESRRRALSVRVLDAARAVGHTYGQVDVTYGDPPEAGRPVV